MKCAFPHSSGIGKWRRTFLPICGRDEQHHRSNDDPEPGPGMSEQLSGKLSNCLTSSTESVHCHSRPAHASADPSAIEKCVAGTRQGNDMVSTLIIHWTRYNRGPMGSQFPTLQGEHRNLKAWRFYSRLRAIQRTSCSIDGAASLFRLIACHLGGAVREQTGRF
jgi:hypothetical protein